MKKYLTALTAAAFLIAHWAQAQQAESLSIAAAADLVYCLEALNAEFLQTHPKIALKVSTGSSGNFFAQIQYGAPFDVFMSADMKYPQALIKAGLADSASLILYAIGRLVLWSVRPDIEVAQGLKILRDAKIKKVAIANPEHAPYGRAAKAALEQSNLWHAIQKKLVLGENIAQTAQFVQSGNAEVGIVALSLVASPKLAQVGKFYEIAASAYPKVEQGAVLTKAGKNNPAARAYLEFLRSEPARMIFDRYGFRLPK